MVKPTRVKVGTDEHAFIMIERENRPTISIDQSRDGVLSIRVDGHFMFNMGTFIERMQFDPAKEKDTPRPIHRFCPLCGEEIQMWSSAGHLCKDHDA